jgi:hypothetical protein
MKAIYSVSYDIIPYISTGDKLTPLLGKQLFQEDSTSSAKKIKTERTDRNDGILSTQKTGDHKKFILSERAIDSIIDHASTIAAEQGSTVRQGKFVKKLQCKQKRIAPDPWEMGVQKKVVTIDVTNYLHVWLQNNTMSTLRRSKNIHRLVF